MDPALALSRRLRAAVRDERVLRAIGSVPRELFVGDADYRRAYENVALPIDCGQTISQPVVVARMLELLELTAHDRVLDVGTGSGYHAALLARMTAEVWTIERHPELSTSAEATLRELGLTNVTCVVADGWEGLPELAPFDAINVAAAAKAPPPALVEQLGPQGRLVVPVGERKQYLVRVRRTPAGPIGERFDPVRFVPLVRGQDAPSPEPPEPPEPPRR